MKITKTPFSWSMVIRLFGRWDLMIAWIDGNKVVESGDGGSVNRQDYSVESGDEYVEIEVEVNNQSNN